MTERALGPNPATPDQIIIHRRRVWRLLGGGLLLAGPCSPLAWGRLPAWAASPDDPRLDHLWRCLGSECPGYTYDPRLGESASDTPPLTVFQDLPDDWQCPKCGAGKLEFHPHPRQA